MKELTLGGQTVPANTVGPSDQNSDLLKLNTMDPNSPNKPGENFPENGFPGKSPGDSPNNDPIDNAYWEGPFDLHQGDQEGLPRKT